jgi:hypothetical protein
VVEHSPSEHKALNSTPKVTQRETYTRRQTQRERETRERQRERERERERQRAL